MLSLLGAKPRSYVPKRAASLELLDPEDPVRRIFPNLQFMDSIASTSSRK